ncbi:uncharacterized protein LOC133730791 [Rosa rugosa]|uniref:uncharacterized protein LOC133730791 n=1 Tax=Rosa rugosa TaxID=74645 RepID=UPI002B403B76|nr:uncharacterized protein LOC133730791 [Rosa rugosa]
MTRLHDFTFYNSTDLRSNTRRVRGVKWSAPPIGTFKVNVDGAFHHITRKGGIGFVIRNSAGHMVAGGGRPLTGLQSAEHAELLACSMAVAFLLHQEFRPAVVETAAPCDALMVQRQVTNHIGSNTSPLGRLYDDLAAILAANTDIHITYKGRTANMVAHILAAHACSEPQDFFFFSTPSFLQAAVAADVCLM